MKITAIKQQVKQAGKYSIFVDAKYSFSLSGSELIKSRLVPGQEIDVKQLKALKNTAVVDKAFGRAINLLSRRPRSEWELRDYLKRKEYGPETIEVVINKLAEYGYIDDKDFAIQWVNSRRLLKSTNKRHLQQELRQKHIASGVIDEVISQDETDDRQVLRQLVDKKRSRYPDKIKFMQYLSRQGYNYDDIKAVLEGTDELQY